ncbi:MAG TPA: hypothetical protein PKX07_07510 [Aggregatilineales bacterium]|nr:hypothetical protein [Aggregatilineales bacterium]
MQSGRSIRRRLGQRHQIITQRRHAPVELAVHRALTLAALGLAAQILRVERRKHGQHLLHERAVRRVVLVFAVAFNAVQLESVFVAQQHLDHDRVVVVARQPVELPEHHRVETVMLGIAAHLVESVALKAPARLRAVAVDRDDCAAAFSDRLAAAVFLRLKAEFVLHLGRIAGIDGEADALFSGQRRVHGQSSLLSVC